MAHDTLYAIGEALIDMIPSKTGCSFAEVPSFSPRVGGAPANVCGAYARLGGDSALLTQLGDDPFGHKIIDELAACGIDTSHICLTDKANTALAFVSLEADGNRTFSFYRKPSADLLYAPEQVDTSLFANAYALHFCSVALVESPMREAHKTAIAAARSAGTIIDFDTNLRFPLWPDRDALRRTVLEFLPLADVVKISDEELEFLTDTSDIEAALPSLSVGQRRCPRLHPHRPRLFRQQAGKGRGYHRRRGRVHRLVLVAAAQKRGGPRRPARSAGGPAEPVAGFFQPVLRLQCAALRCH